MLARGKGNRFAVRFVLGIGCLSLSLAGCNPEKVRVLQGVAVQFQSESLAAIEAIATMREQELAPVSRTDATVKDEFVRNILGFEGELDAEIIDLAIAPYDVDLSPDVETQWQGFLSQLRTQYSTFGSIYDDLQAGSISAGEAVYDSTAIAKKLTAQMTSFASILDENPPLLIQHRSAVLVELEETRKQYQTLQTQLVEQQENLDKMNEEIQLNQQHILNTQQAMQSLGDNYADAPVTFRKLNERQQDLLSQQTENESERDAITAQMAEIQQQRLELEEQTGILMEKWQTIRATEAEILEDTVRQCLKAAMLGEELIDLTSNYNKFSIPTLNAIATNILKQTTGLNSLNLTALDTKADNLLQTLQTSPDWQSVANSSLNQVNSLLNSSSNESESLEDLQLEDIDDAGFDSL